VALGKAEADFRNMDYRIRMSMIFTDPPYADVGMTEAVARNRGLNIVVGRAEIPKTGRAITMGARHGLWKLVVDQDSREIVGATLLGLRADEIAHVISVMMFHHTRVDQVLEMPWYHPTVSEVVIDLARDAIRQM
jgi:pyruvate/2-oxoglutarate dehydrogenase complex dihydrolipoamide dehydrogenase (E3) component